MKYQPIKGSVGGHLFVYKPNKGIIMREYLCYFEECLCLNFLPCVNSTSILIENKNNDTDDFEDCLLDEENDPVKIFEFVTIPSLVSMISYNTSEPIYFIKIVEKNVAICKSWNGELRNGMRGMMGMRAIRVGMQGMEVRMREMGWECGESGWEKRE